MKSLNKGFTLIELVIALSLTAMVLTILASGMNFLINDWQRNNNYLDNQLDTSLAILQIDQALQGAFPYSYQDEKKPNVYYLFFEGKKDSLSWVSTVGRGRESEQTVWRLEPAKNNTGLRLMRLPVLINDPEQRLKKLKPADTVVLFENYTVKFTYLQPDRNTSKRQTSQEKNQWRDKWTAKKYNFLPSAVRIRLIHPNDSDASLEIISPILATEHLNKKRFRPKPPSL